MRGGIRIGLAMAAAMAAAPLGVAGQQLVAAPSMPVFHSNTDLVNIVFSVVGRHGGYVGDLAQGNFQVREDGRPEAIRYFSFEEGQPVTVGILIDESSSQTGALPDERRLGQQFLHAVMRPSGAVAEGDDRGLVIGFDAEVRVLQSATASVADLDRAFTSKHQAFGGTAIWDAVYQTCASGMPERNRRKALVVISNGGDNSSKKSLLEAMQVAQNTNTVVYAILDGGDEPGNSPDRLRSLASATGGRTLVAAEGGLEAAYRSIANELEHQYSLAYVSDRPNATGKFRKVSIEIVHAPKADGGAKVRARTGYTH